MRYTFDQANGLLYVYFSASMPTDQVELEDGTIADVDSDGGLVGLEVLNLAEWRPEVAVKTFELTPVEETVLVGLRASLDSSHFSLSTGRLVVA